MPDVDLRHLEVTLRVATSTEAGVTELDFDVARRFDLSGPGRGSRQAAKSRQ